MLLSNFTGTLTQRMREFFPKLKHSNFLSVYFFFMEAWLQLVGFGFMYVRGRELTIAFRSTVALALAPAPAPPDGRKTAPMILSDVKFPNIQW